MNRWFGADESVPDDHLSIHLEKSGSMITRAVLALVRYGGLVCLVFAVLTNSGAPRKSSSLQANDSSLPSPANPCAAGPDLTASARVLHAQGDFDSAQAALAKYDQALRCWQSVNAHREVAETLRSIGDIYFEIGQYDSARDAHQRALDESKSIGDVRGRILSLIAIGMIEADVDRTRELLARTQEAQALEAE